MKNYLFRFIALAVAGALVAFNNLPSTSRTAYAYFDFIGDVSLESEVEDLSKWRSLATRVCNGVNQQACRINFVSDVYWHYNWEGYPVLNTTGVFGDLAFSIVANLYSSGGIDTYYVASVSNGNISNRARP